MTQKTLHVLFRTYIGELHRAIEAAYCTFADGLVYAYQCLLYVAIPWTQTHGLKHITFNYTLSLGTFKEERHDYRRSFLSLSLRQGV